MALCVALSGRMGFSPIIYMVQNSTAELLDRLAAKYNTPDFIAGDPVQFPRRFTSLPDIEIVALLSATIAWGNRKMICRDCERLLGLMGGEPHKFVMEQAYEDLAPGNVHRTFFIANLKNYLRGLRSVYSRHGSIDEFAASAGVGESEFPAWELAALLNARIAEASPDGVADSRCLPQNLGATALKRLNMALRWLVRDDGVVDMGVWHSIKPSQLYIPVDVHVGNTSRALGLTSRKANDRKAAVEITEALRGLRPADPVVYDFALFGVGIEGEGHLLQ